MGASRVHKLEKVLLCFIASITCWAGGDGVASSAVRKRNVAAPIKVLADYCPDELNCWYWSAPYWTMNVCHIFLILTSFILYIYFLQERLEVQGLIKEPSLFITSIHSHKKENKNKIIKKWNKNEDKLHQIADKMNKIRIRLHVWWCADKEIIQRQGKKDEKNKTWFPH